jgi:aryl-alcohol dehydrogenase-like predicted oxidoreductase
MNYRRLGQTDLVVSALAFGAFGIGGGVPGDSYGPTDDADSARAILAALDQGCSFFDTADYYGMGHSEALIGRTLAATSWGQDALIATKVGSRLDRPVADFSRAYLLGAVEESLRRLRRDHIDLYLLHNPSLEVIQAGEVFETLEELRTSGKIRHGGVSVHTTQEGLAALAQPGCAAIQMVFSLVSGLWPDLAADGLIGEIATSGVGLIAREPLANGFLARPHREDETYGPGDIRSSFSTGQRRLRIRLAASLRPPEPAAPGGPTAAQLALRYVLDEPRVATAVVGLKTAAQVKECFGALELGSYWEHRGAIGSGK